MRITDEDVARMPGTRVTPRRSPIKHKSPYTQMTSREDLRQHPAFRSLSELDLNEGRIKAPVTPPKLWPLPRPLRRSNVVPFANMRPSQSFTGGARLDSKECISRKPTKTSPKTPPNAKAKAPHDKKSPASPRRDMDVPPTLNLRPRPLFHNQQRSVSHGMISELAGGSKKMSTLYSVEYKDTAPKSEIRPSLPRSSSLCSQDPGKAPARPVPPLPLEVEFKRLQRMDNAKRDWGRGSRTSFIFTDNTSVLDDNSSAVLSQSETQATTLGSTSPHVVNAAAKGFNENERNGIKWETPDHWSKSDSLGAAKSLNLRPHLETRRSQRVSLSRSTSSGLSNITTMLEHGWSRSGSTTSLNKEFLGLRPKSQLTVPGSAERLKSKRGVSPLSPLGRSQVFGAEEGSQNKRASTSILQIISGNEGVPAPARPSSIATSDPFQWDPLTSMQRDIPAGKGHKRQNCIRISNIPVAVPTNSPVKPESIQEQEETLLQEHRKPINLSTRQKHKPPSFHPPSVPTFDPQLVAASNRPSHNSSLDAPYSPTLSMFNFYDTASSPPPSPTPIRKAANRLTPGANPNRLKTMFNPPNLAQWPLPNRFTPSPSNTDPEKENDKPPEKPNLFRLSAELASLPPLPPLPPLPHFPSPPRTLNLQPQRPAPRSPIRGPRAPPTGFSTPRTARRSPTRGVGKHGSPTTRGTRDLRASVLALRRMNSEISTTGPNDKDRGEKGGMEGSYLDLGKWEDGNFDQGEESKLAGRGVLDKGSVLPVPKGCEWRRGTVKGPRGMPFSDEGSLAGTLGGEERGREREGGSETPVSMYDRNWFLKD